MSDTPRRRGRPKGTGINDSGTLRTIANLLAANVDLKPTTAIHRAGITDPSVVRRLRDKLKIVPSVPLDQRPVPVAPQAAPASTLPAAARRRRPRATPTSQKTSPPSPTTAAASGAPAPATPPTSPPQPQDAAQPGSRPPPPLAESVPKPTPEAATSTPPSPAAQPATASDPLPDPQLEALRLAAEAAAAMSRLYLHCVTFAGQTSPMSLALRSQTVMSQWFATQMAAQVPPSRTPKSE